MLTPSPSARAQWIMSFIRPWEMLALTTSCHYVQTLAARAPLRLDFTRLFLRVRDQQVCVMLRRFQQPRFVDLSYCLGCTGRSLTVLASLAPPAPLVDLNLNYFPSEGAGDSLAPCLRSWPHLEALRVRRCRQLSASDVVRYLRFAPASKLRELELEDSDLHVHADLFAVLLRLPRLRRLILRGSGIRAPDSHFRELLPRLEVVDMALDWDSTLSADATAELLSTAARAKIIDLRRMRLSKDTLAAVGSKLEAALPQATILF